MPRVLRNSGISFVYVYLIKKLHCYYNINYLTRTTKIATIVSIFPETEEANERGEYMYSLLLETTDDINRALAKRLQNIRKRRKITQKQLAERSNVSYATLRKFEKTGEISLRSLTKIVTELGLVNEIKELFTQPVYLSIDEVIRDEKIT